MDLSGIIFVVLAVAWAVYLIPKALKHHDEVARTRSIDRFSTAMRVLARREPVNRRDARLVVSPPRAATNPRVIVPTQAVVAQPTASPVVPSEAVATAPSRARVASRRAAARAAARRRRRILYFLLLCDAGTAAAAYLGYVPWWSVAIPAGLTLVYLLLCRTQVRREGLRDLDVLLAREEAVGLGYEEFDANEDTVAIEVAVLDVIAVPTEDGGSLWDPLPVTLPTYVTKPKAKRTVRTIDLGEPGTWTSGHTVEDTQVVADAGAAEVEPETVTEPEQQRAVGT